jgi:hypothetical protein
MNPSYDPYAYLGGRVDTDLALAIVLLLWTRRSLSALPWLLRCPSRLYVFVRSPGALSALISSTSTPARIEYHGAGSPQGQ